MVNNYFVGDCDDDYFNPDLTNIKTPLNVARFATLLRESEYDLDESKFLIDGFTNGFDIGYQGPTNRQSRSENIPLQIGSEAELWEKIMKEVKAERVAGPFMDIPYDNFIQSPIGLVPKAGGKTRMIFHLSFDFTEEETSLNACTPKEICSVKYNDLDTAVRECIQLFDEAVRKMKELGINLTDGNTPVLFLGKTDLSSAFRVLPLKVRCFCWLILKQWTPVMGKPSFS